MALALFLHCGSAEAQNTLVAAIWNQYRVAPVVPFAPFAQDSPAAPLPGSTVENIVQRTLDGISIVDLSNASICTLQNFDYPKLRGTQGFRQPFPAGEAANKSELRLLFAFDDEALAAIRSYQVTVSAARFVTIPYDQLLMVRDQTREAGKCSGSRSARTIIKPIIANVEVVFQLTRPFSDKTIQGLRKNFAVDQKPESLDCRLLMPQKLIALGIAD
jgi:hypothetical protein